MIAQRLAAAAFALCLALLCSAEAAGSRELVEAPRPDFVTLQARPDIPADYLAKAEDGEFYELFDSQVRLESDHYIFYRRVIRRVTDRAGLEEAGRLQLTFDPTEETLAIHAVKLWRDGKAIDLTDIGAFRVVQNEQDLSDGVTDGYLTAYFEAPDLRVGDAIEYEVSWRNASPLWPGEFFRTFSTEFSTPVGLFQWRIDTPANKPMIVRKRGPAIDPEIVEAGGRIVRQWRRELPAIVRGEDAQPPAFANWASVSVSTLASWGAVAATLLPHYQAASAISPDLVARIAGEDGTPAARATRAVRFVEDQVRYVADEAGVGSHVPRAPAVVVERGWGDCKDKALLLAAVLNAIGVKADVALADLDEGAALPDLAPSPFAFDHAIVVVPAGDAPVFIDATKTHQGGVFPAIAAPNYHFVLPVAAQTTELMPIRLTSPDKPDVVVAETFDFAGRDTDGVTVSVKTDYSGSRADSQRRYLAGISRETLAHNYLDYYSKLYPGAERVGDVAVTDDRDRNAITVVENYRIPADKFTPDGLKAKFPIEADGVRNIVSAVSTDRRRAPIALSFPAHQEHVAVLKNTGVEMGGIDNANLKTPDFEFERTSEAKGESVTIRWRYKSLANEIATSRLADYVALENEQDGWSRVEYNLEAGKAQPLDPLATLASFFLAAVIVSAIIVVAMGWSGGRLNPEIEKASVLYPVSPAKFAILGFATLGIYAFLWMYRCWRNIRVRDERPISAVFRAIFGVFFYYPLFDEIRRRMPPGAAPPIVIGALLAFGYFTFTIASSIASEVIKTPGLSLLAMNTADAFIFFLTLPLVVWTNRLNAAEPEIIRENSRWRGRTFALLAFGLSTWGMLATISFAPQ